MKKKLNVAAIYHIWPHYRQAVMSQMDNSNSINYDFFGDIQSYQGIEIADPNLVKSFTPSPFVEFKGLMWQWAAIKAALSNKYDAVIFLADQHYMSTWVAAILARMTRKSVVFWSHGWIKQESSIRRRVRTLFHNLANHVLAYSERSVSNGVSSGFPAKKISAVYNSLDNEKSCEILKSISIDKAKPEVFYNLIYPDSPVIVCTSRITNKVRLDILLEAIKILKKQSVNVNVILVGNGPEKARLEEFALENGLSVVFYGACYDENVVGRIIYYSDITVSPGKIGLTAIHSLMYGTPIITHGNLDEQMPEVEAIEPGVTGEFFQQNNANDLAIKIKEWFERDISREKIRIDSKNKIKNTWNPKNQARIIEDCIMTLRRQQK